MNWLAGYDAGWFMGWFGLDVDAPVGLIPGFGPDGAATFALDLENGFKVTLQYSTNVIKGRSGKEQRISRNDSARETYSGSAVLLGQTPVEVRTTLAQYATLAWPFLLALPHEAMSLRADAVGTRVYVEVDELALCDWKNKGQRVTVAHKNEDDVLESVDAVIQEAGADYIDLDRAPGAVGAYGGVIMPLRQIYLEPQQDFGRMETTDEVWSMKAHATVFDFSPTLASLALGPVTNAAGLNAAVLTAKSIDGLPILFGLVDDPGVPATGQLVERTPDGGGIPDAIIVDFVFVDGVTTLGDFVTAMASSTYAVLSGVTNLAETLTVADDCSQWLTGASDRGPVGTGANLTMYATRPVWDYPIGLAGSTSDSVHALTEIIDSGGALYAKGFADMPEGGRTITILSGQRALWQWFKLFISTVVERQKAFWVPTYRYDLPIVAFAGAQLTVEGRVGVWWPAQRQHIHVSEADGSDVYCQITAAVDNGDGTWTVTTNAAGFVNPVRASWLDLCRFEDGSAFEVTWDMRGFSFAATGRIVQQ